MNEKFRSCIMEQADMNRALARIAHEIIERNGNEQAIHLIGVERRGVSLSAIIADNIERFSDLKVHRASINIASFRDDAERDLAAPPTDSPICSVTGETVIIVDDVIHTGRTARAALEAVLSLGRPAKIQLAVLIDRGHRELPIRGDYIGKNVPTSKSELIKVHIPPYDDVVNVELYEK